MPVVAGMYRHEPVEPVKAGPGRLVPEHVPAEPAQARAVWCLSLPGPLKDRKKRCICNCNWSIKKSIILQLILNYFSIRFEFDFFD